MDIYDITASSLAAQRLRLDTISSNLANINTTRKADGSIGAYHRKNVVFAPILDKQFADHSEQGGLPTKAGQGFSGPSGASLSFDDSGKPVYNLGITHNDGPIGGSGVQVLEVATDDETPMRMVYDPSHPDANAKGFVELPNINLVTEMVDMISASRAYEASVTAFQSAKSMNESTLQM